MWNCLALHIIPKGKEEVSTQWREMSHMNVQYSPTNVEDTTTGATATDGTNLYTVSTEG